MNQLSTRYVIPTTPMVLNTAKMTTILTGNIHIAMMGTAVTTIKTGTHGLRTTHTVTGQDGVMSAYHSRDVNVNAVYVVMYNTVIRQGRIP